MEIQEEEVKNQSNCSRRGSSCMLDQVGPLRCGLVRGLFRRQQYRGLRRVCTAYSGSGRWVCFTGQPRTAQEYKGQGSKVPSYLGVDRQMASLLSLKDGLRRIG